MGDPRARETRVDGRETVDDDRATPFGVPWDEDDEVTQSRGVSRAEAARRARAERDAIEAAPEAYAALRIGDEYVPIEPGESVEDAVERLGIAVEPTSGGMTLAGAPGLVLPFDAPAADVQTAIDDANPGEGGLTLFGDDREFHTAWQEWGGMPEMVQRDIRPFGSVTVHFATDADRRAFERLIGQEVILPSLRGVWYPKQVIGRFVDKRYRDAAVPAGDDVPGPTHL